MRLMDRKWSYWHFLVGAALGLAFNLGLAAPLLESARAETRPCFLLDDEFPCEPHPELSAETQALLGMLCEINSAIFNDGSDPGMAFTLPRPVTTVGEYAGFDYLAREVTFNAVWTFKIDLKGTQHDLFVQGVEEYFVVGNLKGPGGTIPIMGVSLDTAGLTADAGFVLVPAKVLTVQDRDMFALMSRIDIGARLVDGNGFSTPISDGFDPQPVWASATDLSTFYSSAGGASVVDPLCVAAADDSFSLCCKGAAINGGIAGAAALAGFLLCLANCGEAAVISGPAAIIVGPSCAAICAIGFCLATAAIAAGVIAGAWLCSQQHIIDLRACGVIIYED